MSVEFIGNPNVRHIKNDDTFAAVLAMVMHVDTSKARAALAVSNPLKTFPQNLEPDEMMEAIGTRFGEGKAVALLCDRKNGTGNSWQLLTGYYLLDGEPSAFLHVMDPKQEAPVHIGKGSIERKIENAHNVLAYALR